MSSAASPSLRFTVPPSSPRNEVQTLCRRICVLRASGDFSKADQLLADELPDKIDAWRRSVSVPVSEAELHALFAAEEERVADARALAEILLPLLSPSTALNSRPPLVVASRAGALEHATAAAPVSTTANESVDSRASATAGTAPGIADFIDEM